MNSDEEQLQIVSYEEPEAHAAASHSENRRGIKMTPKVPLQFDGQSSWFEYEDLIDDWLGITTLDADKHGPSLKNALVGSASFYKSMLDNALLRDPDRGLAHFKDTLRPYFVKGVNHVFLWRFLQMFRTYRGPSEFVHWIGRFEIEQKRLLASWSDLLDLSDLPEAGTQAFTAALTDEQRLHYNGIVTDEDKIAYQQEIREQTITNRGTRHAAQFPLSDNLMSLIFSSRPQRATTRAFCLVNEHPSDSNASAYLSPSETAVLRTFCRFSHRCCRPKHHAPQAVHFLMSLRKERPKRVSTDSGSWMKRRVKKVSHGLYTENDFWVLSAKGSYSKRRIYSRSFKKGKPKRLWKERRKKIKTRLPPEVKREKVMQHGKMTSKTQLSGEKAKEKAKRARKE